MDSAELLAMSDEELISFADLVLGLPVKRSTKREVLLQKIYSAAMGTLPMEAV